MNDQALAPVQIDDATLERMVVDGDCSNLTGQQRLQYYKARCDSAGVDLRAQPFQFIKLNGKLVLYALKGCTDQLASKHGIVASITDQRTESGIRTVTVRAAAKDGRQTDEIGSVTVDGLRGDALANAYMKAVTKAKRRAILSICGLGMLDESEIETIPSAVKVNGTEPPALPVNVPTPDGPHDPGEPPPPTPEEVAEMNRHEQESGSTESKATEKPVCPFCKTSKAVFADRKIPGKFFCWKKRGGCGTEWGGA